MKRLRQLEAACQAQAGALMRDQPVERLAVEDDRAGLVVQGAAEAIDQGRLARAVGADQAQPLAARDRQVDIVQGDKATKALAEPADLEQRLCHHASLFRRHDCTSPTMPLGAMMTNRISSTPTISRFKAEEIVTVASCWIVPSRIEPMTGPIQLVMPPITGIATLLTA